MKVFWFFFSKKNCFFNLKVQPISRAGAPEVGPVEAMPWGETLFYARDPFHDPICFVAQGTEFLGDSQ